MENFFQLFSNQFAEKLPFVAYKNPNEVLVKGILQSDRVIHTVTDYTESGFIFAPFDTEQQTILIPFENCFDFFFDKEKSIDSHIEHSKNGAGKNAHIELVKKGIEAINSLCLSKVVLSRKEECLLNNDLVTLFKNALSLYNNAFVYLWYHPKVGCWIGATPEVLLQTRNNQFKTMALAGTQLYKDELVWQVKEQEEQQIVTDYIAENLAAKEFKFTLGSPYTVKAGSLAHIRTDINGTLHHASKHTSLKKLINTLHPTPAVCGFPKKEAKEFILKNEGYNREFYTGFLGELNLKSSRKNNRHNTENMAYRFTTKSSSLYVNLRCMQVNDTTVTIYAGGGVTANSNALHEYEETCNKTSTMKKVLNFDDGIL